MVWTCFEMINGFDSRKVKFISVKDVNEDHRKL